MDGLTSAHWGSRLSLTGHKTVETFSQADIISENTEGGLVSPQGILSRRMVGVEGNLVVCLGQEPRKTLELWNHAFGAACKAALHCWIPSSHGEWCIDILLLTNFFDNAMVNQMLQSSSNHGTINQNKPQLLETKEDIQTNTRSALVPDISTANCSVALLQASSVPSLKSV